jgi:hypothetical protein
VCDHANFGKRGLETNSPGGKPRGESASKTGSASIVGDGFEIIVPLTVETTANADHFFVSNRMNVLAGFLFGVNAEAAKKVREPNDLRLRLLETREKIPVECKLERRVDSSH